MATKSSFYCANCSLKETFYIGTTMLGSLQKLPYNKVGTCTACKILFVTKEDCCPKCSIKESKPISKFKWINKLFQKESPVKIYKEYDLDKVNCPNCNFKHMKCRTHMYYD